MKQSVVHREITKNKVQNKIENRLRSMCKTNAQRKFLLSKRPNVVTEINFLPEIGTQFFYGPRKNALCYFENRSIILFLWVTPFSLSTSNPQFQ